MARLACIIALTITFALSPLYAYAASVDQAGAQELKTMFDEFVSYQKAVTGFGKDIELQTDGEVTVEPSGTYYAVTLPHLRILYPDERYFEIGIISINAAPHDIAGQWKLTVAVPTPMVMFDKDERQLTRVNIGSQQAAGIWDEEMQYFYKLDALYKDVLIERADPEYVVKIPSVHTRYDFETDDKEYWSGPGSVSLKDLDIKFGGREESNTVGEIRADFTLDQYNPVALRDYKEKVMAVAQNGDADSASPEHVMGLYNMVFDVLMKAGNGFTSNYVVSDIQLNRKSITGGADDTLTVKKAAFGFDMNGFLTGEVDVGLRALLQDFDATPAPEYSGMAPDNVKLDLTVNNIPIKQVSELGKNSLQSAMTQPGMGQLVGLSFVMKLPALLAQSGTYVEIKDNYIAGDDFKITLDGLARADISAVNSATIEADATFEGLENVLERARELSQSPDQKHADKFKKMTKELEVLKSIGKVAQREDGSAVYTYKLVMNPQGKILLNDQDVFKLLKSTKSNALPGSEAPEENAAPAAPEPAAPEPAAPETETPEKEPDSAAAE